MGFDYESDEAMGFGGNLDLYGERHNYEHPCLFESWLEELYLWIHGVYHTSRL